jgi:hypothetical protein
MSAKLVYLEITPAKWHDGALISSPLATADEVIK